MEVAEVHCDQCGFRFAYSYVPGVSFRALRRVGGRVFRCPRCDQRVFFSLEGAVRDPALPTYEDSVGAREFAAIGLFMVGVAVLAALPTWQFGPSEQLAWAAAGAVALFTGAALLAVGLARGRLVGPLASGRGSRASA